MSETTSADQPVDPKEAMRQALERKKAAEHDGQVGFSADSTHAHSRGALGGKRQFRRKAGS